MKISIDRLIGNEALFPVQHRILNLVVLFAISISVFSGIFNYLFGIGTITVVVSVLAGVVSVIIYYLAVVKKYYSFPLTLLIFISIFIITPVLWISNGGTLGGTTLYIVVFSSMITALLRGFKRIAALGSLIIITLALMILEYNNPTLIVAYTSNFDRFADITFGLILILIVNAAFIAIIFNYYFQEYQKSKDYLAQIEKQKIELAFQNDLKIINAKLQQEIEERKQAEKALRMSEERFAKAFQASPIPMCIIASDSWRFIDVNSSFVNAFDYHYYDVIGKTFAMLHIDTLQGEDLISVMGVKKSFYNLDITFHTQFGHERIGLLSCEQIDLHGEGCILCTINDITDHIRIEKEMARFDRLNLVGEMAASIGHEIRNPLTSVRGFLQLFLTKKEFAPQAEFLNLMIEELDRANSIITEFLSLAKNKRIDLATNNLNVIISKLHPLIQADAVRSGKSVNLELSEIPNILLDENEIRQCILNIVRNGLEAITHKGEVTIKTYLNNDNIVLEIKDTGEGIHPSVLSKFGTPFVSTKDTGTGLGIPICYRIAERHKAKIEIKTSSAGTSFFVTFKSTAV
jgi:PAS domain S-box-containing protein